ncbi:hypothetical protein UY3_02964 [Chelonia mydas]|uniref:Uncharacterized protein n=1 Tax=Chelonia mydas TaxID=8469 RepID=M7C5M1_CHEMY|nr:hypothetical protein UY3_02964 [Chelonia mydas]
MTVWIIHPQSSCVLSSIIHDFTISIFNCAPLDHFALGIKNYLSDTPANICCSLIAGPIAYFIC